ncbi:MAG TPA: hypothetical protein VFA68_20890 [Terriglobales bacterium]|nr:hypothetical protein [Terriglobales bacterium]
MWLDKLADGVLRVTTPLGPRYIELSFRQRVYLIWVFRNFRVLPMQVLGQRQQRLVESLCASQRFVSVPAQGWEEGFIIGTVERRPRIEVETLPEKKPSAAVSDSVPFVADAKRP